MKKYSRQREALLTELRSRYDHPTAEDLYVSLRKVMPNYSLGTGRSLDDLRKHKKDQIVDSLDRTINYDKDGNFRKSFNKCSRV